LFNVDGSDVEVEGKEGGGYRKAFMRTAQTVLISLGFACTLGVVKGPEATLEFVAGYLVEQSLSIDNLFVFLLLFDYFKIPTSYQDKILSYGISTAVVLRLVLILAGSLALEEFKGILLVFAGILIFSSGKMLTGWVDDLNGEGDEEDISQNWIVQTSSKLFQTTESFDNDNFFTVQNGIKYATPMLLCLVSIEISDVVFAVDSIPAVFGVTEDPLIIFSSNIFAIASLRSLYTVLSEAVKNLKYLEPAVALVLGFIGGKMIAEFGGVEVSTEASLAVVAFFLGGGVGASLILKEDDED